MRNVWHWWLTLALLALSAQGHAERDYLLLHSTTSTEDSGLLGFILPLFRARSGVEVRVVAAGTGQALRNARRGDADVLLVHSRADEERFVAEGFGVARHDVMYNDFVLVGPDEDPARVAGLSPAEALARIAASRASFASRGDDSGTHKRELALWALAGVDPGRASGTWYRETGAGMGATLNSAVAMDAYALTDRGTWISFENKADFQILVEGDPVLFNPYGVILVDPARHPHVKAEAGQAFIDWLIGPEGQSAIASYKLHGEQLFFPSHPAAP